MRIRIWHLLLAAAVATPAFASYGDPKPTLPSPSSGSGTSSNAEPTAAQTMRQNAEPYYKDAYNDVMKGSKAVADGKGKNAEKSFHRALDRSNRAVEIDSTYFQAWNLVGFASRKLGNYPGSFAAYRVALRLNPDFALAREYYGEGLLETGDLNGAMAQLVELKRIGDQTQIDELQKAIDRHHAAHPETANAAAGTGTAAGSAPADTTAAAGK